MVPPRVPMVLVLGPNHGEVSKLNWPGPSGHKVTPITFSAMADFGALRGASGMKHFTLDSQCYSFVK